MKSINKFKTNLPEKSKGNLLAKINTLKPSQIVSLAQSTLESISSLYSYLSEKEKTRRKLIEAQIRIIEAEHKYLTVKEEEETKRLKILKEHEIKLKEIENERENIEVIKGIVDQTLEIIKFYKAVYEKERDREALLYIHKEQMKLMDIAIALANISKQIG